MKMSFFLLSISMRIWYLNPRLKVVPFGADLRWAGRSFHSLLAKKRNDLAPDDFTCGKTRDCTLCLVEECRSLTLDNSILGYLGCRPMYHTVYFTKVICLARTETEIQFSSLNSAIPTRNLEGQSRTNLIILFCKIAGKVSEDHHTKQSRLNQNDIE